MTERYNSVFDATQPDRFDRSHIFLRIVILMILGTIGAPLGWICGLLYLILPAAAAILIAVFGAERFLAVLAPRFTAVLHFVIDVFAYLMLLTDTVPTRSVHAVRFDLAASGGPSVGSALLRLIYSIPHAVVLFLLSILSGFFAFIAGVCVLASRTYPSWIFGFQRGALRWLARVIVYHASLADKYPPFAFDSGQEIDVHAEAR